MVYWFALSPPPSLGKASTPWTLCAWIPDAATRQASEMTTTCWTPQ